MIKNNKICNITLIVLLFLAQLKPNNDNVFIKKFITDYGFKPRDRYTHEYSSALLDNTAISLDELEESLSSNGFDLAGRMIISGYEEQAFPSYYYRYKKAEINDEAQTKINAGWTLKLHNIFGFLTGFLFRDLNIYTNHWFMDDDKIIQHVDSDKVEIFNTNAKIIHEHAFDKTLNILNKTEFEILKNLKIQNYQNILRELVIFWTTIYKQEAKVGENKDASTQDILFSIEYANHLMRSNLPFKKWYFGPDITYPIETSLAQPKEATLHAQKFTSIIAKELNPIDDKPTAYIFCSFVDGVGKSTLLGNIRNFFKFGTNIDNYDRVDNSSSQLAEIFKLKENTFIADLPAQVSHFSYKPDGYVYVNIDREFDESERIELELFIKENKNHLEQKFLQKTNSVKNIINQCGYLTEKLNNINNPISAFIKNLILLKKESSNNWISFSKDNKQYLFNKRNTNEIRILTPLNIVQSEGLKNIESEQMLFLEGIKLPLPYSLFTKDLINKLKNNNIEKVVFVDFTSMYPRSSRENVRINYLIQQMCLLDNKFNPELSLYRNFVQDSELLYLLNNKKNYKKMLNSLKLETKIRLALLNLINQQNRVDISGIDLPEITNLLNSEISKFSNNTINLLNEYSKEKLIIEKSKLEKIYGKTKNYINIQQLSFDNLLYFSELISDLYKNKTTNKELKTIWKTPAIINNKDQNIENGVSSKIETTIDNEKLFTYYTFDPNCKNEILLTPFLRTIRTFWYSAITNLFNSKITVDKKIKLDKTYPKIAPIFLTKGTNKKIYLTQRLYPKYEKQYSTNKNKKKETEKHLKSFFNYKHPNWININETKHLLSRTPENTSINGYAFGYEPLSSQKKKSRKKKQSAITFLIQNLESNNNNADKVITTSKFYKKLKKSYIWKRDYRKMLKEAIKNSKKNEDKKEDENKKKTRYKRKEKGNNKIILGKPEQVPIIRLIVRLLATLEMIAKDPNSEIVIRPNNKKDFRTALKVIEQVTLPKYFGIIFEHNIFGDYNKVKPYPNWEAWESL